jgi:formate hydrogenlyase transcriptional activator
VNVRLIAATNRNLEQMIAAHEFRRDLFYRLNVFPIQIPPLRERREDIPLLVRYFVQKYAREMQKPIETIPSAALKHLQSLDWPGNIRELENFMERAVILTSGKTLAIPLTGLGTPPAAVQKEAVASPPPGEIARIVRETISEMAKQESPSHIAKEFEERQKEEIVSVLKATNGRVGGPDGAAARMGIKRTTLISRMEKYGLSPKQFSR